MQQFVTRGVLEQEPAGAGAQRLVDVVVEIERREHQHADGVGHVRPGEASGRFDPVEDRHADVHQHDVGSEALDDLDRVETIGGLTDHLDVGLGVEDRLEAGAHDVLIVDHDHPDRVVLPSDAVACGRVVHVSG